MKAYSIQNQNFFIAKLEEARDQINQTIEELMDGEELNTIRLDMCRHEIGLAVSRDRVIAIEREETRARNENPDPLADLYEN